MDLPGEASRQRPCSSELRPPVRRQRTTSSLPAHPDNLEARWWLRLPSACFTGNEFKDSSPKL